METVIVAIDAVVNVEAVDMNMLTLDNANAVIGSVNQNDIAHSEPVTAITEQVIRAPVTSQAAWWWSSANWRVKLRALAVDRSLAFDGDVRCVDGEEKRPVPVNQCRVAAEWDCVDRVILSSVRTAKKFPSGGDMQCDVALELDRSYLKGPGRNQHGSSAILMTGIDGSLQCICFKRDAITFGTVFANIVNTVAGIIRFDITLCLF